jgi:hypothetical protein
VSEKGTARVKRLVPPRVHPVEVWDWPSDGAPLQAWRQTPSFPARLARMVCETRARPPEAWPPAARALAPGVRHVHLTGGGAVGPGLVPALEAAGLSVTVADAPRLGTAREGAARLGLPGALCIDVGQTSVKLAAPGRLWCVERDWGLAPMRDEVPLPERPRARASTVAFLASALAPAAALRAPGQPVVLALPCEWTEDGLPLSCSYCWPAPDAGLLPELAAGSGLPLEALHVLNDAELAAAVADGDGRLPAEGVVLVLTLGFGVGGALLERGLERGP